MSTEISMRSEKPGVSTLRLILVPAMISLAVTVLRLVGELSGWSEAWFSTAGNGFVPRGLTWLVGITWLALPFGFYFGWRLSAEEQPPVKTARALGFALAGLAIFFVYLFWLSGVFSFGFPQRLLFAWSVMVVAAALQWLGWPALFKTLLAYGLASRIPVVVVMFLAMLGRWGTHYDYRNMLEMPFWPKFLWMGFFPQLILWVAFTILTGSVTGGVAAVLRRHTARNTG